MTDTQSLWDARYAQRDGNTLSFQYDFWLACWMNLFEHNLEHNREERVLDIGCGSGCDSEYMTGLGYKTISIEQSGEALRICRQLAPEGVHLQVDIRKGLPFRGNRFRLIIANLSLHYFTWQRTEMIVKEVKRCLQAGGLFFVRLNSTKDTNYGACGHKEIEPNLFLVNGEQKRFFDKISLDRLFMTGWKIHGIEEMSVDRFSKPKVLWEIILEKSDVRRQNA